MNRSAQNKPPRRQSAHYARIQKRKTGPRQGLLERARALKGKAAVVVFGGAAILIVGIVLATGGTAYALGQENNDSFCASCHTQPESKYYEQSLLGEPTTLAAFHTGKNTRCIDCHSGGGPLGRAEGLFQGTQDLFYYYSGNYHHPAITTNRLSDDSCLKCHTDVLGNPDFQNHFHQFLARWQSLSPSAAGCVDCHTAHPIASASSQYLIEGKVEPVCQACHSVLADD